MASPSIAIACTTFGLFVPRWIRLAMPDDVRQEIAMAALVGRTEAQRRDWLRYRLRELRRTQWDRAPRKAAQIPHSLRPSKISSITGYRTDSAAHRQARLSINAEERRAIARKGAMAIWHRDGQI